MRPVDLMRPWPSPSQSPSPPAPGLRLAGYRDSNHGSAGSEVLAPVGCQRDDQMLLAVRIKERDA
jgi:hypothetical protein